ncbi:MAG: DUF4129 domain-containing protein [Chloroflexi bacterium]|nr:DUF4129 domain-containing protein [Chloroflexota bacterium]
MLDFWQSLRFWEGVSWRRNALFFALVGMEMAWFTPFVMALDGRSWNKPPIFYLAGLWAVMVVMMAVAHFLAVRQIDSPLFEMAILGTIVAMTLLIIRLYVFWDAALFDLSWPRRAIFEPGRLGPTVLVLVTMGWLWWRSVTFLQRDMSFFTIGLDFRKGVLALAVTASFYGLVTRRSPGIFIYLFFFFSLMAVSLGRVEDKRDVNGGVGRRFSREWLFILAGSSAAVVGVAALFNRFWSREGFAGFYAFIEPALAVILKPLIFLVRLLVLAVLGPLITWLVGLLRGFFLRVDQGEFDRAFEGLQRFQEISQQFPQEERPPPAWLAFFMTYVIPALIVIVALILLVWWLDRARRARRESEGGGETTRVSGEEAGLVREGLRRLREYVGMARRFGLGRKFYAALSVRHIYANVQRLAAERGHPRQKAQTPNDYLPELIRAFPTAEEALRRITDAYNAFEYGQVPVDEAELAQLRAAWDAVRHAPRPESRSS